MNVNLTMKSFGTKAEVANRAWEFRIRESSQTRAELYTYIAGHINNGEDPLAAMEIAWKIGFIDCLTAMEAGAVGFMKPQDDSEKAGEDGLN